MRMEINGIGPASASASGALSSANFSNINNWFGKAVFNILDYGADPTGTSDNTAAINAAMTALAANSATGGQIFFPPGYYNLAGPITITTQAVEFVGASVGSVTIRSTSATNDMFLVNNWFVGFKHLTFNTTVNKTAGYCINAPAGYNYCLVDDCNFSGQSSSILLYRAISMSNLIMVIRDVRMIFVSDCYIYVNAGSTANQYMHNVLASNSAQLTTGGIYIASTGSMLMSDCDIVNGGQGALNIAPPTGTTIPSIEAVNCFFDTSGSGLYIACTGTGSITRSKFTNCWFGSHTAAGINFASTGGGIDGITFVNCDLYGSVNGVSFAAAVNNVSFIGCRLGGNTTAAFNIAASSSATFISIFNCVIGAQAGFGVNGTGLIVATGTYAGLVIQGNVFTPSGNTTVYTLGTVTAANYANYRIVDNAGINPKGAVTAPTVAASAAATTNNTGFRCMVYIKTAGAGATLTGVNGVATVAPSPAAVAGSFITMLDPGGTITFTYTTVPVLNWVAN